MIGRDDMQNYLLGVCLGLIIINVVYFNVSMWGEV